MELRKFGVTIEGERPLLMDAQPAMQPSKEGSQTKTLKQPNDVELSAYRMPGGNLCLPAEHVRKCFMYGAGFFKIGKRSAKTELKGLVWVEPEQLDFKQTKYEIDQRSVMRKDGLRTLKIRPRLDNWKLTFTLMVDHETVKLETLKNILIESGRRCGLGSFRIQRDGTFGRFKVVKFMEET